MSNARFYNKGLHNADPKTLAAIIEFFENGGEVTVCEPGKRSSKAIKLDEEINTPKSKNQEKVK